VTGRIHKGREEEGVNTNYTNGDGGRDLPLRTRRAQRKGEGEGVNTNYTYGDGGRDLPPRARRAQRKYKEEGFNTNGMREEIYHLGHEGH
jgi:hypothetical protein